MRSLNLEELDIVVGGLDPDVEEAGPDTEEAGPDQAVEGGPLGESSLDN
jgi:hypothetical protein